MSQFVNAPGQKLDMANRNDLKKIKVPRIKRVNAKIIPDAFYVDQPKQNHRKLLFKMKENQVDQSMR